LISTYKLLRPSKFGNCSIDDDEVVVGAISFEEFKSISGRDVEKIALQKLKDHLDLIVEQEWRRFDRR